MVLPLVGNEVRVCCVGSGVALGTTTIFTSWLKLLVVFVLEHCFESGGDFGGGFFDPELAVFGGGGGGVAHDAAGGDVAGEPGEGGGGVFREQELGVFDVGDVVGGVGGGVDEFWRGGEEERRFRSRRRGSRRCVPAG